MVYLSQKDSIEVSHIILTGTLIAVKLQVFTIAWEKSYRNNQNKHTNIKNNVVDTSQHLATRISTLCMGNRHITQYVRS